MKNANHHGKRIRQQPSSAIFFALTRHCTKNAADGSPMRPSSPPWREVVFQFRARGGRIPDGLGCISRNGSSRHADLVLAADWCKTRRSRPTASAPAEMRVRKPNSAIGDWNPYASRMSPKTEAATHWAKKLEWIARLPCTPPCPCRSLPYVQIDFHWRATSVVNTVPISTAIFWRAPPVSPIPGLGIVDLDTRIPGEGDLVFENIRARGLGRAARSDRRRTRPARRPSPFLRRKAACSMHVGLSVAGSDGFDRETAECCSAHRPPGRCKNAHSRMGAADAYWVMANWPFLPPSSDGTAVFQSPSCELMVLKRQHLLCLGLVGRSPRPRRVSPRPPHRMPPDLPLSH